MVNSIVVVFFYRLQPITTDLISKMHEKSLSLTLFSKLCQCSGPPKLPKTSLTHETERQTDAGGRWMQVLWPVVTTCFVVIAGGKSPGKLQAWKHCPVDWHLLGQRSQLHHPGAHGRWWSVGVPEDSQVQLDPWWSCWHVSWRVEGLCLSGKHPLCSQRPGCQELPLDINRVWQSEGKTIIVTIWKNDCMALKWKNHKNRTVS